MSEQWEMCIVESRSGMVYKKNFSSSGVLNSNYKFEQLDQIICVLLAAGWEPFQVENESSDFYYFRRRAS